MQSALKQRAILDWILSSFSKFLGCFALLTPTRPWIRGLKALPGPKLRCADAIWVYSKLDLNLQKRPQLKVLGKIPAYEVDCINS